MSALHLEQIKKRLNKVIAPHISMEDQTVSSPSYDAMLVSRSLAAYIVHHLTGCDPSHAANAVVDGSGDNGIDAIYFHDVEEKLYLVQSKWFKEGKGEPENASVKKLAAGVNDLLAQNYNRFNSKVNARVSEIDTALAIPSLKVIVVLVHSGNSETLSEISSRDLADLEKNVNDASETLTTMVVNQKQLHISLTEDLNSAISVEIPIYYWGKVQEPHHAIYGMVSASDLGEVWQKHKERLVAKNLRGSLGDTEVNQEMRDSLDQRPEQFWYFNNGVTATAKLVTKSAMGGGKHESGYFRCEELYVVNGAQTVSTIGKYIEKNPAKDLSDCFVHFRVIQLGEAGESFGDEVTRTNNRQNKIEARDFVSQDEQQKRIRSELLIENIHYQIMRHDERLPNERAFDLQEGTTAVACSSGDVATLVMLKNQIGRLWEDTSKAPYKSLFNPNVSGIYVWNSVQVLRMIEQALEKKRANTSVPREQRILVSGNRILAGIVFRLIGANRLADPQLKLDDLVTQDRVQSAVNAAADHVLDFMKEFYARSMIPNFFKNQTKSRELFDYVARKFAKSQIFSALRSTK
jgi:AIPR protein